MNSKHSLLRAAAVLALGMSLSACATASRVGDALWPFNNGDNQKAANDEGRISILTFEQQLAADPTLAERTPTVPPATQMAAWSQPGGNAANAPGNVAGAADLKVAWREGVGEGSNRQERLVAAPVVLDGVLYLLDAGQEVRAVDAATGRRLWSKKLRGFGKRDPVAVGGGVAAADGRLFVTSGFGGMFAFDAKTGAELWKTTTNAPFHAAPTAAGGRVFAVTNDSELVALDAATGQVAWTHQAIAEPARILAASSPAVQGDTVIAPFASGEVVALLAANGRRLWVDALTRNGRLTSLSAINDIAGRPVVSDGVIYAVSHSGVLAAIDQRSGQRIWARGIASTQTPLVVGDALYIVTTEGELAALEKARGGAFWVTQLPRYRDEEDKKNRIAWAGPIMIGGQLLLASSDGKAILVDPAKGAIVRTLKVDGPVFVPPIAVAGTAYLVTDEARLVALR